MKGPMKPFVFIHGGRIRYERGIKDQQVGKLKSLRMDVTRAWKDSDCKCWRFTWLRAAWRVKCGEAYVRA